MRVRSTQFLQLGRQAVAGSRPGGFTLTELMVVLVIVALILVLVVPAFSTVTLRTKLKSAANEMVASVYFARGEAIKRNTPIRLCIPNADGDDCKGSGSWEEGWIVMDPNEVVLQRRAGGLVADGIRILEASSSHTVTFNPFGLMQPALDFKVCQSSPPSIIVEERRLTVSSAGRPRVETTRLGCP